MRMMVLHRWARSQRLPSKSLMQVAPEALAAAYEALKGTRALLESASTAQAARELRELDSNSRTMQLFRSIAGCHPNPDLNLTQNPTLPREQTAAMRHSRASRPSISRAVSFLAPGQQAALDAADEPPLHKPRRLTAPRDGATEGPEASSSHADDALSEPPGAHKGGSTGSTSAMDPPASDSEQTAAAATSATPAAEALAASATAGVHAAAVAVPLHSCPRAVAEQDHALGGATASHGKRPSAMLDAGLLPRQSSTLRQGAKRRTRGMSIVLDAAQSAVPLAGSPTSQPLPPHSRAASEAAPTAFAGPLEARAAAKPAGAADAEADLAARPPTPYYSYTDGGSAQPVPTSVANGSAVAAHQPMHPAAQTAQLDSQAARMMAQPVPNGKRRSRSVGGEAQPGPPTRRGSGAAGTYRMSSASGGASAPGRGGGGGGIGRYRPEAPAAQDGRTSKGAPGASEVRLIEPLYALPVAAKLHCLSGAAM